MAVVNTDTWEALESAIDVFGLSAVVETLAEICLSKANSERRHDRLMAREWTKASVAVRKSLDAIDRLEL